MSEYHRDLRRKRRAAGECVWCSDPARPGQALCAECSTKRAEQAEARRESGKCRRCSAEYDGEMWACDECRAKDAERMRARRQHH